MLLESIAGREDRREAILAVNDEHGALAIPLRAAASWSDSALSNRALARNLERNQQPPIPVIPSTEAPPGDCSLVAMRVPKQLAYFEYQLATLAATAPRGTPLLLAGMDKHLSPNTAQVIERYIGPTERHPGQRKARVFETVIDGPREDYPLWAGYYCQPLGAELRAMANVFSRDALDQGSAFLLSQLRALAPAERAIDLACGNGVLGLAALAAGLALEVVFCDESAMAGSAAQRS